MPRDVQDIVSIMFQRRTADSRLIRQMIEIRDRYNGDIVFPFSDVKGKPGMKPPVPNLIVEALDGLATRANSVPPRMTVPPEHPDSDLSRAKADMRRRALSGRWFSSQLILKRYRAFRHLAGYGTFSFVVMPDAKEGHASIELRDPLTAYPELRSPDDIREPLNVGFVFGRSASWILARYPKAQQILKGAPGKEWDVLWDVVEWIDEDDIVIALMGPRQPSYGAQESRPYAYTAFELSRVPNLAGCVPVVSPRRVTLDRIQGQLTGMIEQMDLFGRVTALDVIAMERGIFPDMVIISQTGGPPKIYSGNWHDGRSGLPNLIGQATVEVLDTAPPPSGQPIMQNLERAIRSTGGAFGSDQAAAMRTGAGVDALSGIAVDPRVQEAQTIMGMAHTKLNDYVQAVEKGYFPSQKFFVIPGLRGDMNPVEYVPEELFDFTPSSVDYPYAGLDISQLSVAALQLQGAKITSRRQTRQMHPLVEDGPEEEQQIDLEAMDDAFLSGIQARLEQGQLDPAIAAHMRKLIMGGKTITDAYLEAQGIVNAANAAAAPTAGAPGSPASPDDSGAPVGPDGQPLPPDAQRMLAAVGSGPPGAPAAIGPPAAGLSNEQKLNRAIGSASSVTSPGAI